MGCFGLDGLCQSLANGVHLRTPDARLFLNRGGGDLLVEYYISITFNRWMDFMAELYIGCLGLISLVLTGLSSQWP